MQVEDIYRIIPELHLIVDEQLKQKCAETWLEAAEIGKWELKGGIEKCPLEVGTYQDDCPVGMVEQVRIVTKTAVAVYDHLESWINEINHCERDILVASAILHGIGKLIAYDLTKDGCPIQSREGYYFSHVVAGANLAQKHGLPPRVVFAILSHDVKESPEQGNGLVTPETLIVRSCNHIVMQQVEIKWAKK